MARVVLDNLVKRYGPVLAVDHVSLECADQEFLALLGPSGCGKTSTMRMIAGLEEISDGQILIGDRRVNDMPPAERNVAMAFENYGLYPHMTVFANIAYPLRVRGATQEEIVRDVVRVARLLQIERQLDRRPGELSGGVQQRISLARALVRKPAVFLMDEPISHLDADLRAQMRGELKRLHQVDGSTTIYVTHDQLEALSMADRIAVMHLGILQQVATPIEIFERPANRFVATFIGEPPMNILSSSVQRRDDDVVVMANGHELVRVPQPLRESVLAATGGGIGPIDVGVRAANFRLAEPGEPGLPGLVRLREVLGDFALLSVVAGEQRLRVQVPAHLRVAEDEAISVTPDPQSVHFFDSSTGVAIREAANA